jgi:SAM-dependent methyltransferase
MPVALRRQKMVKEYYTDDTLSVRFYDAITSVDPHIRGDVDFYAAYLRSPGERVLELGCGTGRVAIALAARGFEAIGIDNSEPMLRLARLKRDRLPPARAGNVDFLQHDMVTLDVPARFHLVVVPYYSFNHVKGGDLRARCLGTIAKHLLPEGRAIIHAASPEMFLEPRATRKSFFQFPDAANARLEVTWNEGALDEGQRQFTQVIEYELLAADGARLASSAERLSLWWFSDDELEASAREAGLEHERTFGSFTSERGSARIYVLRKDAASRPIANPPHGREGGRDRLA